TQILEGGLDCVLDLPFSQDDPVGPPTVHTIDWTDATALGTRADLRLLVHLDFGDHPAGRGVPPDEVDTSFLADHAATSVAADEILRSEQCVTRNPDVDAALALRHPHDLAATQDRDPELVDPAGQDALEVALPEREHVVVAGRKVADVQRGVR